MFSVCLKCVSRFFQLIRIPKEEFVSNFALQMSASTRAYEWYSALKSGGDVVEDLPRCGRPSMSSTEVNIAKVKEMVTENRHLSLREIAAELSVFHESIRTILNDCLDKKRFIARLVPKDLNFIQNHIYLIWLQPTFFSFQNLNYHFEAPFFSQ